MPLIFTYRKGLFFSSLFFLGYLLLAWKFNSDLLIALASCCMVLCAIVIFHFKLEQPLYALLLGTLMLSLEIPLLGSSRISLPDEILIVLLSAVAFIHLLWNEQFLKSLLSLSLGKVIFLHACVFLMSSIFSNMLVVSLKFSLINIIYMTGGIVITLLLLQREKISLQRILHLFSIPLLIIACYTIIHFAPHRFSSQAAIEMAQPFFKDHTLLSACLSMFIPLYALYPVIYKDSSRFFKSSAIGIALLLVFIVMISSSRAAWLSLAMTALFFVFIQLKIGFKSFLLLIVSGITLSYFFSVPILEKLNSNSNSSSSEYASLSEQVLSSSNIHNDVSNLERLNRWKCAIRMAQDKPFLGFGPGTYQFEYLPYQLERDKTAISVDNPFNTKQGYGGSAHSEYFLVLSEMGLMGLSSWLLVIFFTFKSYFDIKTNPRSDRQKRLIADAIILAIITFLTHSFFNNFLNTAKTAIPFWILMGYLIHLNLKLKYLEKSN